MVESGRRGRAPGGLGCGTWASTPVVGAHQALGSARTLPGAALSMTRYAKRALHADDDDGSRSMFRTMRVLRGGESTLRGAQERCAFVMESRRNVGAARNAAQLLKLAPTRM